MNHIATQDRIHDAVERDVGDRIRLERLHALVTNLLDALIPDLKLGALEHPDRRWHPEDLAEDLKGHIKSIKWELGRLRGPLVLSDDF